MLNELTPWKQQVDAVSQKEVGTTLVFLQGDRLVCRMKECNLGNLIADGYVDVVQYNFLNKNCNLKKTVNANER